LGPRHTGDFSLFRIYADENNEPVEYSENNVPYKPIKHFPVSLKGVKKGDFTMVFGYPGSTEEYLTSYAVDMKRNIINPHRINIRDNIIEIMSDYMEKDPKIRIQYAAKYFNGVTNGWKKWKGENRGLDILNAVAVKEQREKVLTEWINANKDRIADYGHLLPKFQTLYGEYAPYKLAEVYFYETIWSMESVKFTSKMASLLRKGDKFTPEDIEKTKKYAERFYSNYNLELDKKLFKRLLTLYYQNAGDEFQPELLNFIKPLDHFKISEEEVIEFFTDFYFENTFYLYPDKFDEFIEKYSYGSESESKIKDTPGYNFFFDFINIYYTKIIFTEKYTKQIEKLKNVYMRALMEADTNKVFYPDANFTLRVTYGQVDTYEPKDGVKYQYYTSLDGVIEKDNPEIYDYNVPDKLKELYNKKDYGKYAEDGEMHVCFIASNHTSGGNSGSPVINGNGELIGVNFDRNWEGTMSDIMYNPDQCRNISLDIRYVLFIIDKFAGATHLIDEMTIVE